MKTNYFFSLFVLIGLIISVNANAANPEVVNGVATYHSNKNIGQKFKVPDSWNKIIIKKNVTVTGSFYMPTRTKPIEIMGESRKTSIIKGTGKSMHHDGTVNGRRFSAIRCDKSPDVYIHDLRSLNPDKFHFSAGFGKVTVVRCDIIDNRGQHTTDGIHGGAQKVVVKDCYIDTHDDALYISECILVENTTIVHNHNGSPFQIGWGKSGVIGYETTIRNCTVIDASTKNSDYNQGVVSWAGRNGSGKLDITINFEGTFKRETRAGANTSHMYQIGRKSGGIKDCTIKVNGMCNWKNSQKIYGNTNSKVTFSNCGGPTQDINKITDLNATAENCSTVALTWTDNSTGEEGFRVRRKVPGGSYVVLTDVAAGVESYTDNTATESTDYIYMVRPMLGGAAVETSNTPQVSVPACDNVPCSTPGQTQVSKTNATCGTNNGKIKFTFTDDAGRTNISFSIDGGNNYTKVNDNTGSYTFSGLAQGTYNCWVQWGNGDCPTDLGNKTISCDGSGVSITFGEVRTDCNNTGKARNIVYFSISGSTKTPVINKGTLLNDGGGNYRIRDIGVAFGSNTTYTVTVDGESASKTVKAVSSCPKSSESFALNSNKLTIYPNPAYGQVSVLLNGNEPVAYKLINVSGQIVRNSILKPGINDIEISELQSGIYYLIVISENLTLRKALIVK